MFNKQNHKPHVLVTKLQLRVDIALKTTTTKVAALQTAFKGTLQDFPISQHVVSMVQCLLSNPPAVCFGLLLQVYHICTSIHNLIHVTLIIQSCLCFDHGF